jgi:hypothetical protein
MIILILRRATVFRSLVFLLLLDLLLTGCAVIDRFSPEKPATSSEDCPVSEPVRLTPPVDAAIPEEPVEGNYFANADQSIMASAWWTEQDGNKLHAGRDGNKTGWFRPDGAALEITGQRLDGQSAPLIADVPCCYPTRFQPTGLIFPTAGCWEVTGKAEDSEITFVVWVEP